jgi:ribosomal protein L24
MINKLKVGSKVEIISGTYKGLVGKILLILKKRLINIDIIPKRIKFNKKKDSSKKLELISFIDISNIRLYKNKLS